jgi:DNA ligase-1
MLFEEVASFYEKIEGISSRLEMMNTLAEMFKKADKDEIKQLVYLTQGIIAPPFTGIEIGIAEKFDEEAIARVTGFPRSEVEKLYKKKGDLGIVAKELIEQSKQKKVIKEKLSVNSAYEVFYKIATTTGEGSQEKKISLLAHLFSNASPIEAKFIARFPIGKLRLGVGDPTIIEALSIAKIGNRSFREELERAYNLCCDLGRVAEVFYKEGKEGISNFKITLFSPIRPALAERLPSAEEIIKKMNGKCAVEAKYDGLRMQVHIDKKEKKVMIFSRRIENLTNMFPDIVEACLKEVNADKAIIEGEAIGYNEITKQFFPFQETIQRKRKHEVKEKAKEIPIHLFAFDLLYENGKDYTKVAYKKRREELERIIRNEGRIKLAEKIEVKSAEEIERFFEDAIERGLEGIVAKDLEAHYIAGARKFAWIKMKRSYRGELSDTLDLVILGYFLGRGLRAEFEFGGLLCGVYDKKKDMFKTIAKIGSGFTEEQMQNLKKTLDKIRVDHKPARVDSNITPDFWVEPKYVIVVAADEITKSPTHTACKDELGTGLALRFPRMVSEGIRSDKSPEDATTTEEVLEMFKQQRKKVVEEK